MLFKRKPKSTEWMKGLLLAESLHKEHGYTSSNLYRYHYNELMLDFNEDFGNVFLSYCDEALKREAKNAL